LRRTSATKAQMSVASITAASGPLCDLSAQETIDKLKANFDYGKFPDPVEKSKITGHTQKVYDAAFSGDGTIVATCSQDNSCLTTNVASNLKTSKAVKCSFVMGCALNSNGKMLAFGGMDNAITLTDLTNPMEPVEKKKIAEGHEGYISRLAFVDDKQLLTTSGDGTAILWDLTTAKIKTHFKGHTGDCNSLSIASAKPNMFATGSTDKTCRVWDMNTGKSVRCFTAASEVNCVAMFPTGEGVSCGLENGAVQFYDVGSYGCVNKSAVKNKNQRVLSIATSISGRWTYAGLNTGQIQMSDTFCPTKWKLINAHQADKGEAYVCAMQMAKDGACLATASYDGCAKIWMGPPTRPV